ncbi:MAG TPA: nitrilase-related carbon-nitrogen hydrolase, partial [Candidatus Kapabacteria bacterium]|nr:nitrilase-related carbon-nitrogen hydrolase [Candidatus Kapabacteria bacterium]
MKIACCQFSPAFREVEANLERMRSMARAADADIIVFPELALTGYFFRSVDEITALGQPIDGEIAKAIADLARAEKKAIVTGFLESANGKYYNSSLAFDSNGTLAGHYRKVHRFYYETQIFERGDLGFPVFDLTMRNGSAKVGMMICYDWRFPEAARSLAIAGAELIAVPSNIVTATGMLHTTLQTRAFENKVVLAFADRTGTETNQNETLVFRGESAIINYNGENLLQASKDNTETIVADVDLSGTREKRINVFNDLFED